MKALELLAPAKTADIGIAAVDCGADAVYIAGPSFGARSGAGNSVEDLARLCTHAHRFGARVFATVNTIIYEDEIPAVRSLVSQLADAGVDALIVQDPAVLRLAEGLGMAMHASTQCAVRSADKAKFVESLGYGRLVLERQMSLEEIRKVASAVSAEIEFFVHGALCVCYSGQCYLSEYLTGRSANRGECAQACRSLYDVVDASGAVLARDRAILSLKDYNLIHRLEDLASAGVTSFKIEGRLKGESYVRNVVRAYSQALDALVAAHPDLYRRASFGHVSGGFVPDLDKTFNRGYTSLFIDGVRGSWAAEGGGEYVGTVSRLSRDGFVLEPASVSVRLANGDGFSFTDASGSVVGFRADVCDGYAVRCKQVPGLAPGVKLYRNLNTAFERSVEASRPVREIGVRLDVALSSTSVQVNAVTEDGRTASASLDGLEPAQIAPRALQSVREQLSKRSGIYAFSVASLAGTPVEDSVGSADSGGSLVEASVGVPFVAASALNGLRRSLAEALDAMPLKPLPLRMAEPFEVSAPSDLSYKANVANSLDREIYASRGAATMEDAYELTHRPGVELMRSRYCVRHELGLCPRSSSPGSPSSSSGLSRGSHPLYLLNNGRRLLLRFHCATCEMTVEDA